MIILFRHSYTQSLVHTTCSMLLLLHQMVLLVGQHATFDSQSGSYYQTLMNTCGGFQGFETLETLRLPLPYPSKPLPSLRVRVLMGRGKGTKNIPKGYP